MGHRSDSSGSERRSRKHRRRRSDSESTDSSGDRGRSRSRDRKKRLLSMAHNPHVEKEGGKVWKRDKENDHYKKDVRPRRDQQEGFFSVRREQREEITCRGAPEVNSILWFFMHLCHKLVFLQR
ncbi:arginine/serine-rich protein PNISR-like [Eurytemora carolleeae]|uniref:arginine/serine-rich protein PNISR-like n=1 Tax=Eurytemora carolleeae TaxID=1294199 RepID=UPI000C758BAA|nr:arginine/serine-rich protein PNISR-like [Eurytemora carolleeae]|eukprot:XP_023332966.1 arginine/serine-rich protein PNISR-like [Eurytemora affinis]